MLLQYRTPDSELALVTIDVMRQELKLVRSNGPTIQYRISTAARGTGCMSGSHCTPTGAHRVRLKIGEHCPAGAVFRGRRPTGEIFAPELADRFPGRDWILSRILWLEGMERGINRGGQVDTLRRLVYIHGTSEEKLLGRATSHGCIRMGNRDIIELFELVSPGTPVHIV